MKTATSFIVYIAHALTVTTLCGLLACGGTRGAKFIEWYTERCSGGNATACQEAIDFAMTTHPQLVDGIMPCCQGLQIDCSTGTLMYNVSHYDFSLVKPFLEAGKSVRVTIQGSGGGAACCRSAENCTMLENKEKLASQLLEIALKFNLTGFTGDWEWGEGEFYWASWNKTMSYIASVLKPHGIGIGNSVASWCASYEQCTPDGGSSDPCCCPAYRNQPWADVLTDMGSYSISNAKPKWFPLKDCPPDPNNDPSIIQYCGFEGFTMNFLHSPVATVYTDRAPQISPALWIGDCFPNGTTKQGWTQDKLRSFLLFLDTQNIQRIGLWCMTNESDPIGFPCPVESCPWIYEELLRWKTRRTAEAASAS